MKRAPILYEQDALQYVEVAHTTSRNIAISWATIVVSLGTALIYALLDIARAIREVA